MGAGRLLVGGIAGLAILAVACGAGTASADGPAPAPTVVEVIDGDTIVIEFGGRRETVRLLGIDTPESVDPNRPVQCFGAEASARLAELAPAGAAVRLERDAEARDRYGRLLAYLFVGGAPAHSESLVNELLLEEGFGALAIYAPNTAYRSRLAAAEMRARTAVVGLWQACGGADVPIDPPPP